MNTTLQEATERTVWRLIRDAGKLSARVIGPDPDQRETGAKVWDLIVRLTEDRLAKGRSLQDLLVDTGIQAFGTAAMIRPYLDRTQVLLDRGVRTADLDLAATDRWPITASPKHASIHIDGLIELGNLESEDALDRHQHFQRAAGIAEVAEDIADLATLSPLAAIAQAVALGARLEHLFIVNLPLIYLNQNNLQCVQYLSTRAAELAFDSAQPIERCDYRRRARRSPYGEVVLATHHSAPSARHPLEAQFQSEADQYRQAVEALIDAMQAQDSQAIEQAVDQLIQAEEALGRTLEEMQIILLEQETLDETNLTLIEQGNAFAMRNFALYLAVAETLMARQAGDQPQTELSQVAQAALSGVDEVQKVTGQINLALPAGKPVLVIRDVAAEATPDQQLRLDVGVRNVGTGEAVDVKVVLLVEEEPVGPQIDLGTLAAGEDKRATLEVPLPSAAVFTVQVWDQDRLMGTYLERIPVTSAPSQKPGGFCGGVVGLAVLPLLALIWSRLGKKSRFHRGGGEHNEK